MKLSSFSKAVLLAGVLPLLTFGALFAQQPNPGYSILPEVENPENLSEDVSWIGEEAGEVRNKYNDKAVEYEKDGKLGEALATGVMTRNTILQYIVYLVKFISQIGLVIGAGMIIFAGYKYATNIFGWKTSEGNTAIKYAIIGILVISFAYAIMKIFTSAFLGS